MNKLITFLFGIIFLFSSQLASAQGEVDASERYKAVVGLGYLHTQVQLILQNWDNHPLNNVPLDEFEEEWQQHMIDQLEHDEEWVDFMMVEDNTMFADDGQVLDMETEQAIEANLTFYLQVVTLLRTPDKLTTEIHTYRENMEEASTRLYDVILPELIK